MQNYNEFQNHSYKEAVMKKALAVTTIITILAIGALAFAHGPGWGGKGFMMGPGYGYGSGNAPCGGPDACFGPGGGYGYNQEFFEETADLRKELHSKKFEYFEALRNPKTDDDTIAKLEKEIGDIQDKIHEKAPKARIGKGGYGRGGYGCRW